METKPTNAQIYWNTLMEIFKEFTFESAHRLPNVPDEHKCSRMHGHSYRVEIHVAGQIDPITGWIMDFADITKAFAPLLGKLDHHVLNEIDGLEVPTSENLSIWIWNQLHDILPLTCVVVRETSTSGAIYRGDQSQDTRP